MIDGEVILTQSYMQTSVNKSQRDDAQAHVSNDDPSLDVFSNSLRIFLTIMVTSLLVGSRRGVEGTTARP